VIFAARRYQNGIVVVTIRCPRAEKILCRYHTIASRYHEMLPRAHDVKMWVPSRTPYDHEPLDGHTPVQQKGRKEESRKILLSTANVKPAVRLSSVSSTDCNHLLQSSSRCHTMRINDS